MVALHTLVQLSNNMSKHAHRSCNILEKIDDRACASMRGGQDVSMFAVYKTFYFRQGMIAVTHSSNYWGRIRVAETARADYGNFHTCKCYFELQLSSQTFTLIVFPLECTIFRILLGTNFA